MNAGLMDRIIDIEQETVVNTNGSISKSWAALYSQRPAWVRPERGSETVNAQRMESVQRTQFQIRWVSGLNTKMRIKYDDNYYNIESIVEIDRRRYLQIVARLNA